MTEPINVTGLAPLALAAFCFLWAWGFERAAGADPFDRALARLMAGITFGGGLWFLVVFVWAALSFPIVP